MIERDQAATPTSVNQYLMVPSRRLRFLEDWRIANVSRRMVLPVSGSRDECVKYNVTDFYSARILASSVYQGKRNVYSPARVFRVRSGKKQVPPWIAKVHEL
jgi:hypothetical protein